MQAVVAAGLVAQQERRRLASGRAGAHRARKPSSVGRVASLRAEGRLHALRDRRPGADRRDAAARPPAAGSGAAKYLYSPSPKRKRAMSTRLRKRASSRVQRDQLRALLRGEERGRGGPSPLDELALDRRPVDLAASRVRDRLRCAVKRPGGMLLHGRYPTERASSTEAKTTRLSGRMCRPWMQPTRHTMRVLVQPSSTGVVPLQRGEPVLHRRPEDVAAEAAVAPPHAVARQDQRHRIATERGTHRAHRARMADALGHPRVGARLAERDVRPSPPGPAAGSPAPWSDRPAPGRRRADRAGTRGSPPAPARPAGAPPRVAGLAAVPVRHPRDAARRRLHREPRLERSEHRPRLAAPRPRSGAAAPAAASGRK